jgi:hypothetical protein
MAEKHKSVEEFSVETLEVGGIGGALQALRLPYGKEPRSVIRFQASNMEMKNEFRYMTHFVIDEEDGKLISTLVKRGDEHAKILRGVVVWCEINAPRYFYQEMDRYRIGCECLSSESTMHIQGQGLAEDELVEMKENLPEGTMQRRVWMFSYQTLRRIYFQRKDHRLPQWRIFCKWILTLPFSLDFITCEK